MNQLFSKSANTIARILVPAVLLGGVALAWAFHSALFSPYATMVNVPIQQPVPFSHQHHAGELGIDCRYCHPGVETSAFAGLPSTETCMTCHSQVWKDAPVLEPVRQSWATGRPLRWVRVNDLPDYVYFNHSIHVQKGVACVECHGPVAQMPLTWKSHSLYMRWCLDCHEAPEKFLRPHGQIFNVEWQPPPDQLERGRELIATYHISTNRLQQLRDCSMCHR
jgi:hypothetical protein